MYLLIILWGVGSNTMQFDLGNSTGLGVEAWGIALASQYSPFLLHLKGQFHLTNKFFILEQIIFLDFLVLNLSFNVNPFIFMCSCSIFYSCRHAYASTAGKFPIRQYYV